MVQSAGRRVSPKSDIEKLTDLFKKFDLPIQLARTINNLIPAGITDHQKQEQAAFKVMSAAMQVGSQGRAPLVLRKDAQKKDLERTFFARQYGTLSACSEDEAADNSAGPADDPETLADAPIISANRISSAWSFETLVGRYYIFQQHEQCGTAPDFYGDIVLFHVPKDTKQPLVFKTLATSSAEGGTLAKSSDEDKEQVEAGDALQLTRYPTLTVNQIGQHLFIFSKGSGGAAVFDIPTMKHVRTFRALESPLDIHAMAVTSFDPHCTTKRRDTLRTRGLGDRLIGGAAATSYIRSGGYAKHVFESVT